MSKRKKKPKIGRPPTERGAYNPHPARQLGRVSDEEWEQFKQAAYSEGLKFTPWALGIIRRYIKRAARRQKPGETK
jgi:hypothetical protein